MIRQDVKKEVNYIGRDFSGFRKNLVNLAKIYYPDTYNDFNESSPGMMFIEMAAYVGDVLSYYMDSQFKEMLLWHAEQRKNIISLAETLGYKVKPSVPANTMLDVYQLVPNDPTDSDNPAPDLRYGLIIKDGLEVKAKSTDVRFRSQGDINFRTQTDRDPMEISVYETDGTKPTQWLLKKSIRAQAGTRKTAEFIIGDPIKYNKIVLSETDIISIENVVDSDGNVWYETPYLAQDTVYEEIANTAENDPDLVQYSDTTPYLLRLNKTSRRFIVRVNSSNQTELRFGAGVSDNPDEEIIPNPSNIGSVLTTGNVLNMAFDPTNFLYTKAYGQAPSNTTLSVTYTYGGGIESNIGQGELVNISSINFNDDGNELLNADTYANAKTTIAVNNSEGATGGKSEEHIEEIRNNALAYFSAQMRAVTREDYITRIYSLPAKFGNIAKAYIVQDEQLNQADTNILGSKNNGNAIPLDSVNNAGYVKPPSNGESPTNNGAARIPNPLALNAYVLGYNKDKRLTQLNTAVKNNLKSYISQYRMMTDAINIKSAYIINIGVNFEIGSLANYNKREVVLKCIDTIRKFFDIEKWQINQPIILTDLIYDLSLTDGVRSVTNVEVVNKYRTEDGYSGNVYDIPEATRDNIIYPSADPSIFELKYYNSDIKGLST
tara:strand:- start:233 stop:2215 length:1983 start_codon:yes stop_codon:yes gene_type:complete